MGGERESLWGERRRGPKATDEVDVEPSRATPKEQRVLDLQQQAGNAAVAGAVQRSMWGDDDSWLGGVGTVFPAAGGGGGMGGPDTAKVVTDDVGDGGSGAPGGGAGGGSGGDYKEPEYKDPYGGGGGEYKGGEYKDGAKDGGGSDGGKLIGEGTVIDEGWGDGGKLGDGGGGQKLGDESFKDGKW